jgi:hypothetical protein
MLHLSGVIHRGSMHMNECDVFGGMENPYQRGRLEGCTRCYKGGGSGAAVAEQRLAREQSAAQFREQMALMRQQYEDSKKVKTPVYAPASPAVRAGAEVYAAGMQARIRQQRRFGSAATRLFRPLAGGATPPAGGLASVAAAATAAIAALLQVAGHILLVLQLSHLPS